MILEAMVTESKFKELTGEIPPMELKGVTFFEGRFNRTGYPMITAEASLDKMLELAQGVQAGVITDLTDVRWDRLVVTAYAEAPHYRYGTISGQICYWSSQLGEGL